MRTRIAAITAVLAVSAVVAASAASLGGLPPGALQAGGAAVTPCDVDGVTVAYTVQSGLVTSVTIGGIADPPCEGGDLRVTVTNAGASVGAGGPVAIPSDGDAGDNSVNVAIAAQPAAGSVTDTRVSIEGP